MQKHPIKLTSGEIAPLWTGYLGDSMANCVLHYFLRKVEDEEVRPILEYALSLTNEHMAFKDKLFRNEDFPIPRAFTGEDVNPDAPRLFSDTFTLLYLRQMGTGGMTAYGLALASSTREDIRAFFNHNLKTAAELYNKATTLLLEKGLLPRVPHITYPRTAEFVQKEGWLNGLLGDRRTLNAAEITHLHLNILTNRIGQTLMQAFAQCVRSKDVIPHIVRGMRIATKHIEVFSSLLRDDHLPAPETWEAEVTDSVESPFSDKLMLHHTLSLSALGLSNYGAAVAGSMRRDLATVYIRLAAEVGTYADDGAELMIRKEWLEKMPGAIERDALIQA
ncbi:DUF3231 family protein [Paenibacillus mucilaginosus]|uniref:DUF3231 family protein n=2 Tax=Paenibacillus mucilaginosus TaxID=61624 RepID=H6NEU1_9BACL|nr:DUF3231 family protein [Paenibacillus mucilaginosus]AFC28632.1 hypothetical protein PM3016_1720 [Paenibacillus mucilaginosus 3016]MCG7216390.1 DUF3231 family protein [Paenibacillus mucilaginosus]WDM29224.1 DUF3231 family protein [Paenibacillus mucilaginosus]WFA17412.1 DUF3231 family protein [Paenibacillus mucilaginosus]